MYISVAPGCGDVRNASMQPQSVYKLYILMYMYITVQNNSDEMN